MRYVLLFFFLIGFMGSGISLQAGVGSTSPQITEKVSTKQKKRIDRITKKLNSKDEKRGLISLILGTSSIVFFGVGVILAFLSSPLLFIALGLALVGGIVGLIFGIRSLKKGEANRRRGIAGILTSSIGLFLILLSVLFVTIGLYGFAVYSYISG